MKTLMSALVAMAVSAGIAASTAPAIADSHCPGGSSAWGACFYAQRFFDELGARGGSMPSNFDHKTFFEDLKGKGMTSSNPIGPKQFFAELQSRGVSVPSNFDHSKFLEESKLKGIGVPEMVDMKK